MKRISGSALAIVLLAGCGGGGGPSVHPATTYRSNGPGDTWSFSLDFDFGQFGKGPGTMVESLSTDTYNNAPSIKDAKSFRITLPHQNIAIDEYAELGTDGSLLAELINGTLLALTSSTFRLPPTIDRSTAASGTLTFSGGYSITQQYRVVGAERITVPAGKFDCWVVSEQAQRSDGSSDNYRFWIAPETGHYVQATDTTDNGDGTGYTYTMKMTSMQTASTGSKAATIDRKSHIHVGTPSVEAFRITGD
ncbi:MAG TPA: hypothetical protein VG944_14370 [Fimbriimonas sp.]|nr:hypothetical protein [Fimbriimonas sp.]